MSLFLTLFRLVGGWLVLAAVAGLISGLSNASLLAMINHSLTLTSSPQWLEAGIKFALLALLMLTTRVLSQTTFMFLGQKVKARLRSELVQRISNTPWLNMEKTGMARTLSVFTQDLDTLVVFFVSLPNLFIYGAMIAGCLIYLATLSITVFGLALAAIILGSVGYQLAHGRALGMLRRSRQREDTLMQQCKTLFDGGREYRLNTRRRRQFIDGPLTSNIEAVRQERTRGYVLYGLATSWGSVLFFSFIGIVMYALRGMLALEPVVVTGYTMVFLYMIVPVEGVLSALPAIASARVALQRVQQLSSELQPETPQQPGETREFSSLELTDVRYEYQGSDGEHFTLGPLSLRFQPGELVFLVGGNGSGKTTFANLLVGLYPPDHGEIRLNGETITAQKQEMYRQQFGVVFSDFFLFRDVAFRHARTGEQVDRLLHLLRLDHKVTFHDDHFSTTALSQGQRKRLALIQCWIEQRPFYVFDEWAADQDPEFKEVFYRELLPALKSEGKTIVAISHDDRYFHLADRIIKLEDGKQVPA